MANNLERVLRLMAEKNASDVYMAANTPILIKINGQILQLSDQILSTNQTRQLLAEMLAPQQMEELEDTGELNIGLGIPRVGSFRLSAFKQRGSIAAVFRCIPFMIPTLDSLGMPAKMCIRDSISARTKIVQGAVAMVEDALKRLSEREIVVLDDERKAAMVSNLLVVLCSDRETQPIVNAGTLYG